MCACVVCVCMLNKWHTSGPIMSKKNNGMILWCPQSSIRYSFCTLVHIVNSISNKYFQHRQQPKKDLKKL
ncbi:hypothetical protein HanPSC8_Chr10g0445171 [Helianthus annuus]|nr:hypothetical protein HanPSC8_Chr10g0445171 [Helianthus annuus]